MSFHREMIDGETAAKLIQMVAGETMTFIGRCEARCRHGLRLDLEAILVIAPDDAVFPYAHRDVPERIAERGFVVPEGYGWITAPTYLMLAKGAGRDRCPEHGVAYRFKELKAVLVSTSVCSADCEEATGANCKCSCGGANHGRAAA